MAFAAVESDGCGGEVGGVGGGKGVAGVGQDFFPGGDGAGVGQQGEALRFVAGGLGCGWTWLDWWFGCWECDRRGYGCAGDEEFAPPFVVKADDFEGFLDDADLVFEEEVEQFNAVDEADASFVGGSGLFVGAGGEVAGGDDDALLVDLERAAQLGDGGALDVVFPAFDLDGGVDFGEAGGAVDADDIDATVLAVGCDLNGVLVEAHLEQEFGD